MATAPRPDPAPVAHRAPDWLTDAELDDLLATPAAAAALRALHARPELPRAARAALGDEGEEWAEWLRASAGEALAPAQLRELSRAEGQLWPRLCLHVADTHGAEPLRAGVSEEAVERAVRAAGDREGRLWLGLLYAADEELLRTLLRAEAPSRPELAPVPAPEWPPRPRHGPAWAIALAALCAGATVLAIARHSARRRR